jgi:Tol biopolymer transport system component
MDRRRLGFVLVTIVVLFVLIITLPALSRNSLSPAKTATGRIVYQSDQSGSMELYLLDLASMESVQLTHNTFVDYSPTYIPTLNKIGYVSDREDGTNLYTMNLDGSGEQAVFPQSMLLDYPDWSPDGKLIAASYTEACDDTAPCNFDLYILDPATLLSTRLSTTPTSEWVPQWSPDGQKIIFSSDRDGDGEIFVVNADGSNLVKLTDNSNYDGRPRWSPDGTLISFETDREGTDWDIYIMNADGSHPRPVMSSTDSNEWLQSWSPDGDWLVYVSDVDGSNELYIIEINGRNQQKLTANSFADQLPVWIP